MSECQRFREAASDYLDGYVVEKERSTFKDHIDACPSCNEFVDEIKATLDLLSELREAAVGAKEVAKATKSYGEYFPEPEVPKDLTDWTAVKRTWAELSELPAGERLKAIQQDARYIDPLLCDWLLTRARRVSSVKPVRAVSIAEAALEIARLREERFGDSDRLVLALDALTWCFLSLRELSFADSVLQELGVLCEEVRVGPEGRARYLATKGVYCSQIGLFKEAEVYLSQALDYHRKIGSRREVLCQLVNLGGTVLSAGDSRRALELCREAESLFEAEQDPPRLRFALYSNLVLALCEARLPDEAQSLVPRVAELARIVGGWYPSVSALWLEGTIALAEHRHSQAERIFQEVRDEFLTRGHLVWYVEASLDFARVLLEEERLLELSALATELLVRTEEVGSERRVRAAVTSFAHAVKRRSLSTQVLSSIAVALSSPRSSQRVQNP